MVNPTELSFGASIVAGFLGVVVGLGAIIAVAAVLIAYDVRPPAMDGFLIGSAIGTTTMIAVVIWLIRVVTES